MNSSPIAQRAHSGAAVASAFHAGGDILMRKALGFAIVSSGFAVLIVQGVQHLLRG
ncbi:hypothetical protein [Paraburkholderia kururiensis]|uniref:Uncharacterized protein n=1 Tax=Paraburkholderia kururiensis TaxID=984307 RepID=A0ABZ0WE96_9BURK|nr:hypothetical protein [Paraburkholderia kururiensis]WQD75681.1 hypothetical protein U0042_16165 [Paraburkholderia kururiensis]